MGGPDQLVKEIKPVFRHANVEEVEQDTRFVKQSQDHTLAKGSRDSRNADVHILVSDPDLKPPVLGKPLFGDVHFGHDLDS